MRKYLIEQINEMRIDGKPPSMIANILGISVNTIKSHIRRHPEIPNVKPCMNCGKYVLQTKGKKEKKFCSDKCRINWWNRKYRGDDNG